MLESFNKHFSSPIDGSFLFSQSHWNTLSTTCFIFVPLFMWYIGAPSDLCWLKFKRLCLHCMWYRFCNVEPSSFICTFITFFARSAGKLFLALIPQNCLPVSSSIDRVSRGSLKNLKSFHVNVDGTLLLKRLC